MIVGLPELTRKLRTFAPDVAKQFRSKAAEVSKAIATEAKNLASWSTRIPGAIRPTTTVKGPGVRLVKRAAPHGGLYERGAKGGRSSSFRHPLFGNRNFWYTQQTRPFLAPAVEANRKGGIEAMVAAIQEAKRETGLE